MKKRSEIKKIFGMLLVFIMIFPTIAGIGLAAEQSSDTGTSNTDAVTDANTIPRNTDEAYNKFGWIFGEVTDQSGNLLSGVYIRLDKLVRLSLW